MTRGVVYVAYGENAKRETKISTQSLKGQCDLPVFVVDETVLPGEFFGVPAEGHRAGKRMFLPGLVKPKLWELTPFEHTLYLDADTRVMADPSPLFKLLEAGWDMGLAPGQAARFVRETNFGPREREITVSELGTGLLHYYNSGVILWAKNDRTRAFFDKWGGEWRRFCNWDEQMALMRALWKTSVKFVTLAQCWNQRGEQDGALIYHPTGSHRTW